jgi:N-acyl-D-amino-acid deacylase
MAVPFAVPDTSAGPQAAMPMTGAPDPGMASFDRIIPELMRKYQIPGGAVAVMKDGRLVVARGYGFADREARQPVEPDSLFRIASLSKAITSATILKLVEERRLTLDSKAFQILNHLRPLAGARVDPRIHQITIRNLLQHSGGWDRDKSFDPMFRSDEIAQTLAVPAPAKPDDIIRYMLGQPLQFTPGTMYAYSNFGYCVLGRIIEKVTGQSYEAYVRSNTLAPAGISCMRIGHTLARERAPNEVRYYGYPGMGLARSVFPNQRQEVPSPYGGWYIEAMDSHGGWIASAIDLLRFIDEVDGRGNHRQLLTKPMIETMVAHPAPPLWVNSDNWYGMGWQVRPVNPGQNWWHTGSLDGTSTIMVRAYNGMAWVALFNSRPKNSDAFEGEVDSGLWKAIGGVTRWPEGNLFDRFRGCRP